MIALNEIAILPRIIKTGWETVDLADHQGLKIKVTGPAADILNVDVPRGKNWRVTINVEIIETDAST